MLRTILTCLLTLILVIGGIPLAALLPADASLSNSAWPMAGHDARHTGLSSAIGPTDPEIRWSFATDGKAHPPAIGSDGTIYLGSANNWFYAINPDGSLHWKIQLGGTPSGSPAISSDGKIYVACDNQALYAFQPDGSLAWNATGGSSWCFSAPAVAYDGTIYVGWNDGKLYAFSPAGNQKWATAPTSSVGAQISNSPAIANDGTVYASVNDDNLYAFNPNGSIRWNVTLGGLAAPPAIGGDGTIYVGTGDKYLYAVNPAGSLKWKTALGGSIVSPMPAIAANGTIYTGCDDYKLYALRPDGSILWSFPTGDAVEATPVIDATGTVFCGSRDGQLYAVKPDGSPAWSVPLSLGNIPGDIAMGSDGIVYVPAGEKLLAVANRAASPSPTPSSSSPSPTPGSFSDLPAAYWAGKEILDLVGRGVLNGYPDGTFRPESPVTRAEFAKMALLSLGLSMVTPPTPAFPDLSPGHWAYAYVEGAVANGLVKGYPDGSYRPEGLVTMAEVFTVIIRAKGWALVNPPPPPPDVLVGELNGVVHLMGAAGDWFDPYLGSAIVNGILLIPDSPQITKPLPGPGPGGTYLLEANMPANRAQTAVFLARM